MNRHMVPVYFIDTAIKILLILNLHIVFNPNKIPTCFSVGTNGLILKLTLEKIMKMAKRFKIKKSKLMVPYFELIISKIMWNSHKN